MRDDTLYNRVLGADFAALPPAVAAFHAETGPSRWTGTAEIRRGKSLLSNAVAGLFGFPPAGQNVPVTVEITPTDTGEVWTRNFGGKTLRSVQTCPGEKLVERFGPVAVTIDLIVRDDAMYLEPRSWTALGLPLPRALLPGGESFETERDGAFAFDVTVEAPLVGLIVAYRGKLTRA